MEMPELHEDILEGESNSELLNQVEDSESMDESALQPEDAASSNIDELQEKPKEAESEENIQQQQNEMEESHEETEDNSQVSLQQGDALPEVEPEKEVDEPVKKKMKLDEDEEKMMNSEIPPSSENEQPEPEQEESNEFQAESESKQLQQQPEGPESQDVVNAKKNCEESTKILAEKEGEKRAAAPDTDMLATLASAALDQDPKDKGTGGETTPKSPLTKAESEVPKKKAEMWCNVGVFDTNTTTVSDYVSTPEPNEHVDLVTATLGGRRFQLEPGTAYKFRVCAVNGCGTGPWSDVAAFKTTLPGFPGAPSAIKISKSPEGAHLTWEPPGGNSGEILEYAVYLAVRNASQGCQPVATNQSQLAFVRVYCGPANKCVVGTNSLQAAHIDTTTKPAIIFRIAARNSKGYGPATQVRWLQESQNGTAQVVKRTIKSQ